MELFGMDELINTHNKWDFPLDKVLTDSYYAWEEHHYSPAPNICMRISDCLKDTTMYGALPVCWSLMAPDNFLVHDDNRDKVMPSVCGNEMGNETLHFYEAMNIKGWTHYAAGTATGRGLSQAIQTSFNHDHTNPVSVFLTYCTLGNRFPNDQDVVDKADHFEPGPDFRCNQFKADLKSYLDDGDDFGNATLMSAEKSRGVKRRSGALQARVVVIVTKIPTISRKPVRFTTRSTPVPKRPELGQSLNDQDLAPGATFGRPRGLLGADEHDGRVRSVLVSMS
ncbi:uncharacterized protein KY384_007946 [Bacidia gigantensis]|uniref:uncharacterized protein n=1 Tax=Bacidia gigantensis TaxID=2732470 RepID=UPI001D035FC1|nr:uncharacterized protein KY384_007946 [Bacidia gigantensis]KAG8527792.1 hypothetical protein KY384_007946 [Bacidia gigantensis]